VRIKPPNRRDALFALAGIIVGFSGLAATTDPSGFVDLAAERRARPKRQRRTLNDTPHDFDAIPPETERVLTRRGHRVRVVREIVEPVDRPEAPRVVTITRRGRRWRDAETPAAFAARR
jgi:hypothetical protein